MFTVPFSGLTPTKKIWVSPSGSNSNDGSSAHPYKTIQFALDHAKPGTAVMVKAGTYAENVEFHYSGTADKPIWLISADGKGKALIKPGKATTTATIEAFGEDYIVIDGFDVSGGDRNTNGIAVTQGGTDFSNLTHHVVIKNNIVHDAVKDGIKVAQGDYVYVVNNRVHHVGDQGIDFVAVNNSVIARNEVTYVTGKAPALFAKGGSTNVLIADNYVAHVANDGISVGGWTDGTKNMRPGYTGWQAKNVVVIDNHVEDVGKRPLVILGAQKSQIIHNYLESNPDYYYVVTIAPDNSSPPRTARILCSRTIPSIGASTGFRSSPARAAASSSPAIALMANGTAMPAWAANRFPTTSRGSRRRARAKRRSRARARRPWPMTVTSRRQRRNRRPPRRSPPAMRTSRRNPPAMQASTMLPNRRRPPLPRAIPVPIRQVSRLSADPPRDGWPRAICSRISMTARRYPVSIRVPLQPIRPRRESPMRPMPSPPFTAVRAAIPMSWHQTRPRSSSNCSTADGAAVRGGMRGDA